MDLSSACKSFESQFEVLPFEGDSSILPCVCSGGTCAQDKPVPILYLDKTQAILAWLELATLRSLGCTTLRWADKPELVRYQITMADNKRGHRVVNDRYSVKSKFVVE